MSEIIIKKNILLTTLTIISSFFIFPLAIRCLLGIYYILFINFSFENLFFFIGLIINFSFENLVFLIGLMILFWIGLRNLISIILFGMKAIVINDVGITYYKWKEKTIYWKDIKNIKLNCTNYDSNNYELIIFMKNGKKKTISLVNISTEFSEREFYKFCLKKLHKK